MMNGILGVLLITLGGSLALAADERPNILLIVCDDLGYADVGFNGSMDIPTPNLDGLAKGGIICASAYVAHPVCGPSRAALLTGRYPHMIGGQFNIPYFHHDYGVSTEELFLSELLQESGYQTSALGKWHLGEGRPFLPNERGFDEFYGHLGGGHKYFPDKYWKEYQRRKAAGETRIPPNTSPQLRNGIPNREDDRESEYLTDAFSREAADFVQRASKKEQPFFLYLAYNAPHTPIEAKAEDIEKMSHIEEPKRRKYAAMVHCVDYGVKRVVDTLKSTGEYDNTLIIFLSDNGGIPRVGASNAPLKGGKRGVEEGGYRVPMFFHWANGIPGGGRFEHPISTLDFFPTLAALAKATVPEGKTLDGKDIWQDLLGGLSPHKDQMIFAMSHRSGYTDTSARLNEWKVSRTNQTWKLYNLAQDIGETNDLSKQQPERLQGMVQEVEEWANQHSMPAWIYLEEDRERWRANKKPYFEDTFDLE